MDGLLPNCKDDRSGLESDGNGEKRRECGGSVDRSFDIYSLASAPDSEDGAAGGARLALQIRRVLL